MAVISDHAEHQATSEVKKKHLIFIVNPFSGTRKKENLDQIIEKYLDHPTYSYELKFTQSPGHATLLAQEAAQQSVFAAIAIGGDGTLNEVAKGLIGSDTALGLLPYGSGNGFAYHLGIRRSIQRAFDIINSGKSTWIDTATANGRVFLNVAGLGLDATVAYKTKYKSKRGFLPYFIQTMKESVGFRYMDLRVECPKGIIEEPSTPNNLGQKTSWQGTYAMAVIANGSVYGYGFAIAPEAKLIDGLFDVLLVKKAPIFRYFFLAARMLNKTFHKSPLVEFFRTPEINISINEPEFAHLDGEGYPAEPSIEYKISKASIRVLLHD